MTTWGWPIIIYLFLGGVGAGAYLVSYGIERGLIKGSSKLKLSGYILSAPCILVGSLLLYFDLAVAFSEPLGVLRMFLHFTSVMTWGIYILSGFAVIGIVSGYLAYYKKNIPSFLTTLGSILALGTAGYTGVLLMVVQGVPFWNTFVLPCLFVVSALSTGMAANSLLAHFLYKDESGEQDNNLHTAHINLVIFEFLILMIFLGFMINNTTNASAVLSAQTILMGKLALPFWAFCIGLGIIFPLIQRKLVFLSASQKMNVPLINDVSVLIGGLSVRAVIIFAAIPAWIL